MATAGLYRFVLGACAASVLSSSSAAAQVRPPIPAVVLSHMQSLDARCRAVGGRDGQGRYVVAQDFNGDGRLDYLLSEGDYVCVGRPGLFRKDGQARVDIFVTDSANNARRVYSDVIVAYRVTPGPPAKVQIARRGAACGGGPQAQCAAQLEWNGASFGEGVSVIRASPDSGPVASAPARIATPTAPAEGAATQADFVARCRRELLARDASASRWADDECQSNWRKVIAAGAAADLLIAVVPRAGERPTLAAIRAAAIGVRWSARPEARELASGTLRELKVAVSGTSTPADVSVSWQKVGAEIPYDVPGALQARGASVRLASCEKLGTGEGERTYGVSLPGRASFGLTVFQRTAPTGNAWSYYSATAKLDGRSLPRGSTSDCDF